jgi:hypothetical protein
MYSPICAEFPITALRIMQLSMCEFPIRALRIMQLSVCEFPIRALRIMQLSMCEFPIRALRIMQLSMCEFPIRALRIMQLSMCEFCDDCRRGCHTFLTCVNVILLPMYHEACAVYRVRNAMTDPLYYVTHSGR